MPVWIPTQKKKLSFPSSPAKSRGLRAGESAAREVREVGGNRKFGSFSADERKASKAFFLTCYPDHKVAL